MKQLKKTFMILSVAASLTLSTFQEAAEAQSTQKSPPPMKLNDPLPANLFVELAKMINPAVVNISTLAVPKMSRGGGY